MDMRRNKGFTIIELVIVTAIVSVRAVAAFARFFDFSSEAKEDVESGEVAAITGGTKPCEA